VSAYVGSSKNLKDLKRDLKAVLVAIKVSVRLPWYPLSGDGVEFDPNKVLGRS